MEKSHELGIRYKYEKIFLSEPDRIGNYRIHQIGEQLCEKQYLGEEHIQWCYEITYVIEGKGMNIINDKEYEIRDGDFFITSVGVRHNIRATNHLRYMFLGFTIEDSNLSEDFQILDHFFRNSPPDILKVDNEIRKLLASCLDEYNSDILCRSAMIESHLTTLLISVMRSYFALHTKSYRSESNASEGLSIYTALLYIDSKICSIRNVGDVQKQFNYSQSYLSHTFRKQMGITLQQYICRRKIEEAIRLMTEDNLSITEVSHRVGFSSPQAFTKAFKRVRGIPPKEYLEATHTQK